VFVLPIGAGADVQQQLLPRHQSICREPLSTLRLFAHGNTGPGFDYSQMTAGSCETLAAIEEPTRNAGWRWREARRRLIAWPKDH
jgi:hypothetical protein